MSKSSSEGLNQPLLEEGWRTNSYSSSSVSLGGYSEFQKRKRSSTKISHATTVGIVLVLLMISLMIISVALNLYASSYEEIATNATTSTVSPPTQLPVVLQPDEIIS